jgi:sulfate adenylyltransferase subunit 2
MDTIAQTFLSDIERHLTAQNIEPSAFGKQALGDPNFIFDLRKGRSPSARTMDKVRAFMAVQATPATPAASAAIKTIATPERLSHLERLEAEAIHIIREVAAECEKPVMLYSIGKDSAVMLHLAMKAFYPAKPPFPLMHVDTRWKFQDMYALRDSTVKKLGLDLITHINPEGIEKDINPFDHGSALHTHIMKTEGLKQALDKYGFDAAFGAHAATKKNPAPRNASSPSAMASTAGIPRTSARNCGTSTTPARTRASRSASSRSPTGPNSTSGNTSTARTIEIVPLYFAAERPIVWRDGQMIMVDDNRMKLNAGEKPEMRKVRFRTLGCYPLTGAIESNATSLLDIIEEMLVATSSERQGRVIDKDASASMEKKKQEGYF